MTPRPWNWEPMVSDCTHGPHFAVVNLRGQLSVFRVALGHQSWTFIAVDTYRRWRSLTTVSCYVKGAVMTWCMAMVARGVWNDIFAYTYNNESLFSYMKAMFLLLQFPTCRLRYVFTLWFSAFKHGNQNCVLYLDPTERVSHASGGLPLPQHFFRRWAKGRSFLCFFWLITDLWCQNSHNNHIEALQ